MKISDLLKNAVALMGGDLSALADYYDYAVASVNTMLADLFEANNALLVSAGEDALTSIPTAADEDAELTYDDRLARNVMVYGLARDLGIQARSPALGYFTRMYEQNKAKYSIAVAEGMTDCYPMPTGYVPSGQDDPEE